MQRHLLAHARDGLSQTLGLNRLYQIIDGVHLERIKGIFAIGGHEHHRRRELQMLQSLGKLQARGLGHVHIKEHDVTGILFELLDGLAHACCLGDHLDLTYLVKQKSEL